MLPGFTPTRSALVLIDGPSELAFDYAIPPELDGVVEGCRVRVPLRNRQATGTVLKIRQLENSVTGLKPIAALIDPEPLLNPTLMKLAEWMADYYAAPLEHVMRVLLPESVRQDQHQEKTRKAVELIRVPDDEDLEERERKAPRQAEILHALKTKGPRISIKELGGNQYLAPARALEKKAWVRLVDEAVRRDPEADESFVETQPLELNEEQAAALKAISTRFQSPEPESSKPLLLLGVTGSGKTEVYLQATAECLEKGKSAIILVPEIALAPQTVQRFKARFAQVADQVAVLHSHLSQGERFDEWHRIRRGEARIVIGARSAVFAPVQELGLIIVDEEHESSYKQETSPRYHGRDLAVLRGHFEKCAVVLGSATPSLETYQNALVGKYELARMTQRVDAQAMPIMRVIDMKMEAQKQKAGPAILSERLRTSMEAKLERGEQVILFLNRRGFARSLQCDTCGHVCECKHCSLPLTYHRTEDRLICHLCGFQAIPPKRCPGCSDPGIQHKGYGTQKVESILRAVFPDARIARIDADTARKKNALKDTLRAFKSHKIDILLGTQMIAKGLHFPNVTLVGILNADMGLHVPDFRAGERTFALLTQVAGRAGRGELEGEVIVQTYTPHSPSIQYARHHDFDGYAEQELEMRQQFDFPPFSHIGVITSRCTHERRAQFTLESLHKRLKAELPAGIFLTDPLPSPLVKAHSQFRFQLTLRGPSARQISRYIQCTLAKFTLPEDVTVTTDIDAFSFS